MELQFTKERPTVPGNYLTRVSPTDPLPQIQRLHWKANRLTGNNWDIDAAVWKHIEWCGPLTFVAAPEPAVAPEPDNRYARCIVCKEERATAPNGRCFSCHTFDRTAPEPVAPDPFWNTETVKAFNEMEVTPPVEDNPWTAVGAEMPIEGRECQVKTGYGALIRPHYLKEGGWWVNTQFGPTVQMGQITEWRYIPEQPAPDTDAVDWKLRYEAACKRHVAAEKKLIMLQADYDRMAAQRDEIMRQRDEARAQVKRWENFARNIARQVHFIADDLDEQLPKSP